MIITRLEGGMGNQMFQYAIGKHLSIKNNTSLGLYLDALLDRSKKKNHTFRNYDLDIFNINAEIVKKSEIPFFYRYYYKGILSFFVRSIFFILKKLFNYRRKGKEGFFHFDKSILSLKDNIYLEGLWQSEKYFIEIEDLIRKDFTLKSPPADNIKNLIEVIEKENSLCIHVRRGDFVNDILHEVIDKDFYDKGIEIIKGLTKIDKIYVFSDDIKWCEDNMKFDFPTMYVGDEYSGKKAEGHHILMRSCKYFIIPSSTFSWWAAWLGDYKDKIVVSPQKWFADDYFIKDYEDVIPSKWIKI